MRPFLLASLLVTTAWAGDLPDFLSTPRGFTYQHVKVLSSTKDSVTISYDGGTATLAIVDLPQAWRDHFKMVEPAAPQALPAPVAQSKPYGVGELKSHEAQLKGQIVPLKISYDSGASLEPQEDESFIMFVIGNGGSGFVVFPKDGAAYMKTLLKNSAQGMMTVFGLVRPGQPPLLVGRTYDPKKKAYSW